METYKNCEYCHGTISHSYVKQEVFKHKVRLVIIENTYVGVCGSCGSRYYSAQLLHLVHEVATGTRLPQRTEQIPVIDLKLV